MTKKGEEIRFMPGHIQELKSAIERMNFRLKEEMSGEKFSKQLSRLSKEDQQILIERRRLLKEDIKKMTRAMEEMITTYVAATIRPYSREQEIGIMEEGIDNMEKFIISQEGDIADYDKYKEIADILGYTESKEEIQQNVERNRRVVEKAKAHVAQLKSDL